MWRRAAETIRAYIVVIASQLGSVKPKTRRAQFHQHIPLVRCLALPCIAGGLLMIVEGRVWRAQEIQVMRHVCGTC